MSPGWHPAIVCLLVALVAPVPVPQSPAPFAVGVLRRDGIVVPFADYDGKRWRTHWPEPKQQVDVPIDVRSVPSRWWGDTGPLGAWTVWTSAQAARTVRVLQLDWFRAQCWKQVGLRTDYRSAQPPAGPDAQPYPKDGLAISPPRPIEPIDIVPPGDPPPPVVDAFNQAERKTIVDLQRNASWNHPLKPSQREAATLNVEAVYGLGDPAMTRFYYFEVSRQYRDRDQAPGPASCATVTFGAGWFVRDGVGPLRPLRFEADVVDCDRYGIRYMLPLGALRLSNRLFWIAQWSGWDYEEYSIVEIKPKTVEDVVRVWGGGC